MYILSLLFFLFQNEGAAEEEEDGLSPLIDTEVGDMTILNSMTILNYMTILNSMYSIFIFFIIFKRLRILKLLLINLPQDDFQNVTNQ